MRRPSQAARFVVLLALTPLLASLLPPAAARSAESRPAVQLVVDYGDGVQVHFTALPWREGMTVVDALAAAQKHPRGIKVKQRGRGSASLVTAIDGVENEGSGRNWLFSVNGKSADVGAGSYQLAKGDTVLWEFKEYDYN